MNRLNQKACEVFLSIVINDGNIMSGVCVMSNSAADVVHGVYWKVEIVMQVPGIAGFRWILYEGLIHNNNKEETRSTTTASPPSLSTLYIHNSPSFWMFPFDFQLSSKEVKFKLMFFISHTKWKSLTLSLNWLVSFFSSFPRMCVVFPPARHSTNVTIRIQYRK